MEPPPKRSSDFSPLAGAYARSRPRYPRSLFTFLSSLLDGHDLAWDVATGNGQAALGLADHFSRVIATDASPEQIAHAAPHPRIEYRVASAERSGLDEGSVDLVGVAAAIHWFDMDAFAAEVRRVVRPGGVLAAWTYHVGRTEPPLDRVMHRLYFDITAPCFDERARLVDSEYATIPMPGEPIPAPSFQVGATWNLEQMIAFVHSWSGTRNYIEERGTDPVSIVAEDLERLFAGGSLPVRWPLFIRVSRLPGG